MYEIPERVNVSRKVREMPELQDRMYRIIWTAISIGHIRDQYFASNVSRTVQVLKKKQPDFFVDFLKIIGASPLSGFGIRERKTSRRGVVLTWPVRELDASWWLRVWQLIKYDGDIELVCQEMA